MKYGNVTFGQVEAFINIIGIEAFHDVLARKAKVVIEMVKEALLTLITTITAPATSINNLTKERFTNSRRYYYRDGNLDSWLPKTQNHQVESKFRVFKLEKQLTFKEMAEAVLEASGDVTMLSKLLIEHKHTTNLQTIEGLIERQEFGENVGLNTNGYANFFFVEDKDGSVSVVFVFRSGSQWFVYVFRLDYGHRWYVDYRLFVRN